jgi:hypothetical protein
MESYPDLGLAKPSVFSRSEAHVTGENELAARSSNATSDFRDHRDRRFGDPDEGIEQDGQSRGADRAHDVAELARQIEVRKKEVGICAFENNRAQRRVGFDLPEQILERLKHRPVKHVERRVVENNSPIRRRLPMDAQ